MKIFYNLPLKILSAAILILVMNACAPVKGSANQPAHSINEIRKALELPELPVEFVENTGMSNSPSGSTEVANYRDREGRIYSVDPKTNLVVEIDARTILSIIPSGAAALPPAQIKAKAMTFARRVIPDFDSRQSSLQYEEGGKVDNYFFTWYGEMRPGSISRPFLQFGFHKSGVLFAYYNTFFIED